MKRFKSRKPKKRKKLWLIIFAFFFVFSYVFMIQYLSKNKLKNNVLHSDVNYVRFNLIKLLSKQTSSIVNEPVRLLNSNVKNASLSKVKNTVSNVENKKVESVVKEEEFKPLIYVYNTHQSEAYMDYTIYDATGVLASNLNKNNLDTYQEENSVTAFLQTNGMKYYESYKVSRKYIDEVKIKYPSITYFFDIHRDALSKDKSTITVGKKNYAKVMFIVGTDNQNYESNYNNAIKLNEIINNKVPGISRGVIKKGGKGVNGVYNQDVSANLFLIEVGGNNNNKEEVINTINVISDSITEYVRGMV